MNLSRSPVRYLRRPEHMEYILESRGHAYEQMKNNNPQTRLTCEPIGPTSKDGQGEFISWESWDSAVRRPLRQRIEHGLFASVLTHQCMVWHFAKV